VTTGTIRFDGVIDTAAFMDKLCDVSGIGRWTAQYVAMRALREPDGFPAGDLGLLRGLGFESERELEQRSEAWRPWRAYAAMYVWNVPIEKTERVNRAAAAAVVGSRAEQRI